MVNERMHNPPFITNAVTRNADENISNGTKRTYYKEWDATIILKVAVK